MWAITQDVSPLGSLSSLLPVEKTVCFTPSLGRHVVVVSNTWLHLHNYCME